MKDIERIIQDIFTNIGNWVEWFVGGYDKLINALCVFIVINYITYIMCALVDKQLQSAISVKEFYKKILIFIFIGMGNILDTQVIGFGSVLRSIIITFYLYHEGISIVNNGIRLGLPVPEKLQNALKQLLKKDK